MSKDPAFLFYSDNFQSGTQFFTNEQTGKYVRLLCAQHLHGHLTEKQMLIICGQKDAEIWAKFKQDSSGNFYNERLDLEVEKRAVFTQSRRKNGGKGGRPTGKKTKKTYKKPYGYATDNHMGNGNEDENGSKNGTEIVMPFDSETFKSAWSAWKEYKAKEKKFTYKSPISEQIALKRLGEISGNNENKALEIIETSIANGWEGLFELKINHNAKHSTTKADANATIASAQKFFRESGIGRTGN